MVDASRYAGRLGTDDHVSSPENRKQIVRYDVADYPTASPECPNLLMSGDFRRTFARGSLLPSSVTVLLEGSVDLDLGFNSYRLDARKFLLTVSPIPLLGGASPAQGYNPPLAFHMKLDFTVLEAFYSEIAAEKARAIAPAVVIADASDELLDCINRLVESESDLQSTPGLRDLFRQELALRVLSHPASSISRQCSLPGTPAYRTKKAVSYLQDNYNMPLRISDLAALGGMGVSSMHHNFRQFTSVSPLQFQKFIRLSEAKRQLSTGQLKANEVARQVGYASPSQFSREYHRLFGASPISSIKNI